MHLGNAAITTECAAVTTIGAVASWAWLTWSERRSNRTAPTLAEGLGWGAFVLAAQSWNIPVLPWASGHLVGGVLLARMLGPARGASVIAVILAVQSLVFGDGGWLAWGCNFLNMGLLPAALVAALDRGIAKESNRGQSVAATAVASAVSVVIAAIAICGEVLLFRGELLPQATVFAREMLFAHVFIGLVEAGLTFAVISAVIAVRTFELPTFRKVAFSAVAIVGVLCAASVLSSSLPDGYEAAVEHAEMPLNLDIIN